MLFRQLIHEDLGCASYLIGDVHSGVAAVVDPQWDVEPYLRLARLHGVRIEHVLETHNHADHVSGHGRLALATGARIHVHRLADAEYPHEPLRRRLACSASARSRSRRSRHAGHRPEHTSFLIRDRGQGAEPVAVLTGDSLFVGDVARPDLAVEPTRGRPRALPLAERAAVRAARDGRGLARAPGRLDVRQHRARPPDLVDDRLRAARTTTPPSSPTSTSSSPRRSRPWPARRRTSSTSSRSTAAPCSRSSGPRCRSRPGRSSRRSPRARCWSTRAPTTSSTRRTSPARSAPRPTTPASATKVANTVVPPTPS